jgi:hypothetical protein
MKHDILAQFVSHTMVREPTWMMVVTQSHNTTYCHPVHSGDPRRSQTGRFSFPSTADTKLCPTCEPRGPRTRSLVTEGSAKMIRAQMSFVGVSAKYPWEANRFLPIGREWIPEPRRMCRVRRRLRLSRGRTRGRPPCPPAMTVC